MPHTTGPWTIGESADHTFEGTDVYDGRRIVWAPDGMEVCLVRDRGGMTRANARLIAAAPAMLAYVKRWGAGRCNTEVLVGSPCDPTAELCRYCEARALLRELEG
jgi:hypothetical protein